MRFAPKEFFLIFFFASLSGGAPLRAEAKGAPEPGEQIFLTEAGALKTVFPDAERVEKSTVVFTAAQKARIESRLGWRLKEPSLCVYRGVRAGAPGGYAVITEEIGRSQPITFIVKTSNEGKVESVEVMVYREAVGAEVRRRGFRRQFLGKSARDPLRLNRDIVNVTGATLSAQAMAAGVKKVLTILDELYFRN